MAEAAGSAAGRIGCFSRSDPGRNQFQAASYCLHAGTHGPGRGDGYLYAPLEGSRSGVIRAILQGSVGHPELPQQDSAASTSASRWNRASRSASPATDAGSTFSATWRFRFVSVAR